MIVTLYKNCILNDKYYEVFDCKVRQEKTPSALEQYLATLDTYEFDVENVYIQQTGNLVLPLEIPSATFNPLEYNYMKCVNNDNDLITYCFINEVVFGNGVIVVNYRQDVWANWSDKCTIRQGLLSLLNGVSPQVEVRGIPVDIATGGPLIPDTIKNIDGTDKDPFSKYFMIIGDIQFHNLVSANEVEEREQYTALFGRVEVDINDVETVNYKLDIGEINGIALNLLKNENKDCVYTYNIRDEWVKNLLPYYDIIKLYIIPYSENIHGYFTNSDRIAGSGYPAANGAVDVALLNAYDEEGCQYLIQEKNYTISDINYTLAGIGIADEIIPIKYGGFSLNGSLNLITGNNACQIIMKVAGTIKDVTPYFELPIWFNSISDSAFEQRVLNYDLNKKLLFLSKARNTLDLKANASRMRRENDIEKKFDLGVGALNTGLNLIENGIRKSALNAEVYGNFEKNSNNGSPFLNAYYGLRMFIYEPANPNFISDIIDNYGFEVEKYVENLDLMLFDGEERLLGGNPCSCTFAWINITGNATQNILRQLEEILLKNTKIYYNGTI